MSMATLDARSDKLGPLVAAAEAEIARRSLLAFAQYMDPNYVPACHVRYLCSVCETIERDEIRHAVILVPPRMGKTSLISVLWPAFWIGRHPGDEIILASNTAGLAEDNSAKVRNLILNDRYPFPTRVSTDTYAKDLWRTTSAGGAPSNVIRAAGVGSSIQGRGGNLLVCDDPIAGVEEATETAFEKQWRWFVQDFFPRRLTDSHVVLSMFRWGDRDLASRVLSHEDPDFRKDWTVVSLPAYAREGDPLGRKPGEVLFPPVTTPNGRRVGFDKAFLETQRKMDSRVWSAQYELDPVPAGGLMFKSEWITQRYGETLPAFSKIIVAVDTAAKTEVRHDWSVAVVVGLAKASYYLLDVVRRKVEFPELQRMVVDVFRRYNPSTVFIEDTSNGVALVQQLRRDSHIPVVPIKATLAKITRAEAITGIAESGKFVLPQAAPWLIEYEKELFRFPNAAHDDQVDATSLALTELRRRQGGDSWFFFGSCDGSEASAVFR